VVRVLNSISRTAAHLRAQVYRLQVHRHPVRPQDPLQRVDELLADPLLHGEPAGEQPN
jgi:hypothetical protein